mgnify:CR=1 FL=1
MLERIKNDTKLRKISLSIITLIIILGVLLTNKVINKSYNGKINATKVTIVSNNADKKNENTTSGTLTTVAGYDTIAYKIKFSLTLDNGKKVNGRTAIVEATLNDNDLKYATWKNLDVEGIESEIINNGKTLKLTVSNVTTNKEYSISTKLNVIGAPNDYEFAPIVTVKEKTSSETTSTPTVVKVNTTSLSGNVINSENNKPESDVLLNLCKMENNECINKSQTYTENDGSYSFSDINSGVYKITTENNGIELNGNYNDVVVNSGNNNQDINVLNTGSFSPIIKKYIKKIEKVENGKITETKDYNLSENVQFPVKNLSNVNLKVTYELVVKNSGEKDGYVKVVKETIPDGMSLDSEYSENKNWKILNGKLYNKTLSTSMIKTGESKTLTIKLVTKDTNLAQNYVNEASINGETYHSVNFIVNDKIIKHLTVLDSDLIEEFDVGKEGYTFGGWYIDKSYKTKFNFSTPVENDYNLYAKLINNNKKCTVKYLRQNGKLFAEKEIDCGTKAEDIEGPKDEEGYKFNCWEKVGEKECFDFNKTVDEDTELTSHMDQYFDVKFYEEDGKTSYEKKKYDQEIKRGDYAKEPEKVPSKKGHEFECWKDLSTGKCFDFSNTSIDDNKDFIPSFKADQNRVIYVDEKNEENTVFKTYDKVDYGKEVPKPNTVPTHEGYTFTYWTTKDENNNYVEFDYENNKMPDNDLYLYAQYTTNVHNVTFIDEKQETDNIYEIVENVEYGSLIIKTKADPYHAGFYFTGWAYKNKNDKLTKFDLTKDTMPDNDLTLYAQYTDNKHEVIYKIPECTGDSCESTPKCTGDECIIEKIDVPDGEVLTPPEDPVKECYTFKYWSLYETGLDENGKESRYDFSTPVKKDTIIYAIFEVTKYDVTYVDNGVVIKTEKIKCGKTIPTDDPNKCDKNDKNCDNTCNDPNGCPDFECWRDSDNPETCITSTDTVKKNTTIVSSYIKLPEPTILHTPTEWTKNDVTVTMKFPENAKKIRKITKKTTNEDGIIIYNVDEETTEEDLNLNPSDYKMEYQIVSEKSINDETTTFDGYTLSKTWNTYSNEFTQGKNAKVVGRVKSINDNVKYSSAVLEHEIINIDKKKPNITKTKVKNIRSYGFEVNLRAIDLQSGVSKIRIMVDDKEVVVYNYDTALNNAKEETYTVSNLTPSTTYKLYAEVYDLAGNVAITDAQDVTTLEGSHNYVAQIIGRNNSLYESTESYELFETLEDAIGACPSEQCTIQMIMDTNESVDVINGQDITLDLNGYNVYGVGNYTIQNTGKLIVRDNNKDVTGSISNNNTDIEAIAINNVNGGILELGENDLELQVSKIKPYIYGNNYGIVSDQSSTLKFFDGKVEGNVAINGEVNETPPCYNAKVESGEITQVATLTVLVEAEARIKGSYYTKLGYALNEATRGTYDYSYEKTNILNNVTPENFDVDLENNKMISTQSFNFGNATASFDIDLTDYPSDQLFTMDISASFDNISASVLAEAAIDIFDENLNSDLRTTIATRYTNSYMSQYYESNLPQSYNSKFTKILEKGKKHKIVIKYRITRMGETSYFTEKNQLNISNVQMGDYSYETFNYDLKNDVVTPGNYGFTYDDSIGALVSNNQDVDDTDFTDIGADSYIVADLTNESEEKTLDVVAGISSEELADYGYIFVTDSPEIPMHHETTDRQVYISGEVAPTTYKISLKPFKKNYIHFGYYKDMASAEGNDQFTIYSIGTYGAGVLRNSDNSYKIYTKTPVLNTKVDTVVLLRDITLEENNIIIPDNQQVEIDLNGHYITTTISNTPLITNNGVLSVSDSKYSTNYKESMDEYNKLKQQYEEETKKLQQQYDKENNNLQEKIKNKSLTTDDYITTSAQAIYDGINHGEEEKVWKNLKENTELGNITLSDGKSFENNSINFNGTNDYLSIGKVNPEKLTIETVMSTDEIQSGEVELASNYSNGGYKIYLENGKIKSTVMIGNGEYSLQSDNVVELNKKYYIAISYDQKTLKMYINGKLVDSLTAEESITYPETDTVLMLGATPFKTTASNNYFKGNIYNFRVHYDALSKENIINNFDVDNARYEMGYDFIYKVAEEKHAVMPEVTHTGEIRAVGGNSIVNNNVLSINDSYVGGTYGKTIENNGTLSMNQNSYLYSSSNIALYNNESGNILGFNNATIYSGKTAIYNKSKNISIIEKVTIPSGGIVSESGNELTVQNIELSNGFIYSYNGSCKVINVKVTNNSANSKKAIYFKNDSEDNSFEYSIKDSQLISEGSDAVTILLNNVKSINIENSDIISAYHNTSSYYYTTTIDASNSNLNIINSNLYNNDLKGKSCNYQIGKGCSNVVATKNSNVNINDSYFENNSSGRLIYTSSDSEKSKIEMNNSELISKSSMGITSANSIININGSTIKTYDLTIENGSAYTVDETLKPIMNIKNSNLQSANSSIINNYGHIDISEENNLSKYNDDNISYAAINNYGNLNIYDKFILKDDYNIGIKNDAKGHLTLGKDDGSYNEYPVIKGKTHSVVSLYSDFKWYDGTLYGKKLFSMHGTVEESPESYDVQIENIDENNEKLYLKEKSTFESNVAQIGDTKYKTLEDAFNSSIDGDTIKLINSTRTIKSFTIPENKNITIDLDGYNLIGYTKAIFTNNGTFTLKDSTTVKSGDSTISGASRLYSMGGQSIIKNNGISNINDLVIDLRSLATEGVISNSNKMDIIDSKIEYYESTLGSVYKDAGIIQNNSTGNINIKNVNGNMIGELYFIENSGVAKITNGCISLLKDTTYGGTYLFNRNNGVMTIDNNTSGFENAIINYGIFHMNNMKFKNVILPIKGSKVYNYNIFTVNNYDSVFRFENEGDFTFENSTISSIKNGYNSRNMYKNGLIDTYNKEYNKHILYYPQFLEKEPSLKINNSSVSNQIDNYFDLYIVNSDITNNKCTSNGCSTAIGIYSSGGTVTLGENDNDVSYTSPSIFSSGIAIEGVTDTLTLKEPKLNFYDGIIKGTTVLKNIKINGLPSEHIIENDKEKYQYGDETQILDLEVRKLKKTEFFAQIVDSEGTVKKQYKSFQTAVNELENNDTLQLLSNINIFSEEQNYTIPENITNTLDLNGYFIYVSFESFISNLGNLTITDTSETKNGKIESTDYNSIVNSGNLTIKGTTIAGKVTNNYKSIIKNMGSGILNLINSKIICTEVVRSNNEYKTSFIYNMDNASININNSEIESEDRNTSHNYILSNSRGKIKATDSSVGTIVLSHYGNYSTEKISWDKDGEYYAELEIDDGSVSNIITEGYYNVLVNNNAVVKAINSKLTNINISDSEVNVINYDYIYQLNNLNYSMLIQNSTVNKLNMYNYTSASIIDTKISSLSIYSNADVQINNSSINDLIDKVYVSGYLTIENGYFDQVTNYKSITVKKGNFSGSIYNEGTITAEEFYYNSDENINNSGTIKVKKGTISSTKDVTIKNSGELFIGEKDNIYDKKKVVISGKKAIENKRYYDSNGSKYGCIYLYDGIIKSEQKIDNLIFGEYETDYYYVPDVDDSNDVYLRNDIPVFKLKSNQKEYLNLESAINASANEDEITLIKDVYIPRLSNSVSIPETKTITLDLNGFELRTNKTGLILNNGVLNIKDSKFNMDDNYNVADSSGLFNGVNYYDAAYIIQNQTGTINIENINLSAGFSDAYYKDIVECLVANSENNGIINITDSYISGKISNTTKKTGEIINFNSGYLNKLINDSGTANVTDGKVMLVDGVGTTNIYEPSYIDTLSGRSIIYSGTINVVKSRYGINMKGGIITGDTEEYGVTMSEDAQFVLNAGVINTSIRLYPGSIYINNGKINGSILYGNTFMNGGILESNDVGITGGNVTISGGEIHAKNIGIKNSNVTMEGGKIESDGNGIESKSSNYLKIKITGGEIHAKNIALTGTSASYTMGENDGVVSTTSPIVKGDNYGLKNADDFYFYDGRITGAIGQSFDYVTRIADNYRVNQVLNADNSQTSFLEPKGEDEQAIMSNGINYKDIESAVAAAPEGREVTLTLYRNVVLTQDIVIPENKTIIIDLNGNQIDYGDYTITGNVTYIDSSKSDETNNETVIGQIINLFRSSGVKKTTKNIIVYEMDDGSSLEVGREYKLQYLENNEYNDIDMVEDEENVGRYEVSKTNSTITMNPINGRLYLNNLPEGEYKLIDNENKKISFSITSDGKLTGNIKENKTNNLVGILSKATSTLYVSIRTGQKVIKYGFILIIISMITTSLMYIRNKKKIN